MSHLQSAPNYFVALSRREILKGGLAAAAVMTSDSVLAQSRELRFLFGAGTWKDWFEQTFVTPFVSRTGARTIWKTGLGFEPLVIAQRSRPQWDLMHQNQNTSAQLGALGAVVEWNEARVPNVAKVHPSFRYPHLVGKVHTPYGLAVNTKRIRKPVESWDALWDPEFAGKVGWPDWVWVGEEVFHAINVIAGGDAENVDPGVAKMRDLFRTNKPAVQNNPDHVKQLLVSEDVWICPYFGARTEQAKAAGAPVEFVVPKEGGLSWIWNTSIIAGRPKESTELAQAFVNDTLDAEKQIAFCRLTGYPPTNVEAMRNLPPDLKRLEHTEEDLERFGALQRRFDYMAMFAYRDRNRERWNKEVVGA
jgi:putative spermidine/putrescine transport system substrate-binding protein